MTPVENTGHEEPTRISHALVATVFAGCDATPTRDWIVQCMRDLGQRALGVDALVLVAVRHEAVEELKRRGVGAAEAQDFVRAALHSFGSRQDSAALDQRGPQLVLADPEPWIEEVGGAELLNDLVLVLSQYVVFPPGGAEAAALWIVHAHAHEAYDVSPILALSSPRMRCGKSTTFTIIGALVPRPLGVSNVSPAALFRTIDKYVPTVLIDEADTFLRSREELIGILNSGHLRAMAQVIRTVGEGYEPKTFSTWAPKAIALIGALPPTLQDRSIVIELQRKLPHEHVESLRLHQLSAFDTLRRKAARFAQDNLERLQFSEPLIPACLNDRMADNWRPLLAIADLAAGGWPEMARHAARLLAGAGEEPDASHGLLALTDVWQQFEANGEHQLESAVVVHGLAQLEGRPWGEWQGARPISQVQLAAILKPFKVRPKKIRVGPRTAQGYLRAHFVDPVSRYLRSAPEQLEQVTPCNDLRVLPVRNGAPEVPPPTRQVSRCDLTLVPPVPPRGVHSTRWTVCHLPARRTAIASHDGPEQASDPTVGQTEGPQDLAGGVS